MIGSASSCTRPLHQALIPLAVSVPPVALFISGRARKTEMEEEQDTAPAVERIRPPSIDELFRVTKFSKAEIQSLYRSFKELWPNGYVALDQFQVMYSDIFPQGNSKAYAELVFRNIDHSKCGTITFEDFIKNYSKMAKGSKNEKFEWIFNLYDSSSTGSIGYNEIFNAIRALYQLVDSSLKPAALATICRQHVKLVLKNFDMQCGSRISREEFVYKCKLNPEILENLEMFDPYSKSLLNTLSV